MRRSHEAIIESANLALVVNGSLASTDQYFAADYLVHVSGQDIAGGHGVVKKFVDAYRRAFEGIQIDIEILVKSKNRMAWQRTLRAIHTGAFKGFPATGLPIVWHEMITTEFRDGLIAEDWVVTDLAENLLLARKR